MTKYDCEICRGSGLVRLPIYRVVVAFSADVVPEPRANSRDYPCPECGEVVTVGQVCALREETYACSLIKEPAFIEHVRESLAHQLVGQLLADGYIKVRHGPNDDEQMRFPVVATLGVVHPSRLNTLERRVAERQDVVAREVAKEAAHQIDNWGSRYGHSEILKRDACRMISDAVQIVLKRRSET